MVLSVTAPKVPVLVPVPASEKTTVAPPVVRLVPAASLACSETVAPRPLAMVALLTVTTDVATETGPGALGGGAVTVIEGSVVVTAVPLIVAAIVRAVPAVPPVNVAVYVPFALSVTAPNVPVLVPGPASEKTIVAPPVVRLMPAASFAWSETVTPSPLTTVALPTVTMDDAAEIGPGPPGGGAVTVILGSVVVTTVPPMVADTVRGVPAVVAVKVALYVPLPASVVVPIVPSLVPVPVSEKTIVAPPLARLLPEASLACSENVAVLPLTTVAADEVTMDCAAEIGPGPPGGGAVTVIEGSVVATALPPMVAPIVRADPAAVAVKVAVYVPLLLSVTAPIVPSLVPAPFVNVTANPPAASALPAASFVRRVSVAVAFTCTLAADVSTVLCATDAGPGIVVMLGGADVTAVPFTVAPITRGVPTVVAVNGAV